MIPAGALGEIFGLLARRDRHRVGLLLASFGFGPSEIRAWIVAHEGLAYRWAMNLDVSGRVV